MQDYERLNLIRAQAKIAKQALRAMPKEAAAPLVENLEQAVLAIEAIALLSDEDFHAKDTAA